MEGQGGERRQVTAVGNNHNIPVKLSSTGICMNRIRYSDANSLRVAVVAISGVKVVLTE
jgi:hypothetical protein